jgi:hypothetical protein
MANLILQIYLFLIEINNIYLNFLYNILHLLFFFLDRSSLVIFPKSYWILFLFIIYLEFFYKNFILIFFFITHFLVVLILLKTLKYIL